MFRATVKKTISPIKLHPIQADGTNGRRARHSATTAWKSQAPAINASNTTNGFIPSAPDKSPSSNRVAQRVPPQPGQFHPVQRLIEQGGMFDSNHGNDLLKATPAAIPASATHVQTNRRFGMSQGKITSSGSAIPAAGSVAPEPPAGRIPSGGFPRGCGFQPRLRKQRPRSIPTIRGSR